MVGVLLTEISMDFTSEAPTLSPGYDSSPINNVWNWEKWEMSVLQRNVGLCGSGCRIDIKRWIKLLSEILDVSIQNKIMSTVVIAVVMYLIFNIIHKTSLCHVSRNRPSVVTWSNYDQRWSIKLCNNCLLVVKDIRMHTGIICKIRKWQETCQSQVDSWGQGTKRWRWWWWGTPTSSSRTRRTWASPPARSRPSWQQSKVYIFIQWQSMQCLIPFNAKIMMAKRWVRGPKLSFKLITKLTIGILWKLGSCLLG